MIKAKDPVLLNVTYIRPDSKRNIKECFEVIYKDKNTGEVGYSYEPPNADIYIVKPEFRTYTYNPRQQQIKIMDKITVPISRIRWELINQSGEYGQRILTRSNQLNDIKYLNQIYKWPYAFGCDFIPEYYYFRDWYSKHNLEIVPMTKAYLDIECDMIDHYINMDDVEHSAYAPVNMISVVIEETKDVYQFLLKPYKPTEDMKFQGEFSKRMEIYEKQLQSFNYMMDHMKEHIDHLHKEFDKVYGEFNYHIRSYEKEIELIADCFRLLHYRKPNFCLIWNMRFDINYLIARIRNLYYDPADIICHPDFKIPRYYFSQDKRNFDIEKQVDEFVCSSYTKYLCQMRNYSNIRKSEHKLRSYKLNDIASKELGDRKVDYEDQSNIAIFMYNDYIRATIYSIKDTLLQFGIERATHDIDTLYSKSHKYHTPYTKAFKETVLLRDVREDYFNKQGLVQANNLNNIHDEVSIAEAKFYGEEVEVNKKKLTYRGAINANPMWNGYNGELIHGTRSNRVYKNAIDEDMGAFYPSIKIACNMDPMTLEYKASFDNKEFISGEFPNRSQNNRYSEKDKNNNIREVDITGEAVVSHLVHNDLTVGYNWFGLPSIPELFEVCKRNLKSA